MESGQLVKAEKPQSLIPGAGVAGQVFCPQGFAPHTCNKGACEYWVELDYAGQKVARCTEAWKSILKTEERKAIDKLRKLLEYKWGIKEKDYLR